MKGQSVFNIQTPLNDDVVRERHNRLKFTRLGVLSNSSRMHALAARNTYLINDAVLTCSRLSLRLPGVETHLERHAFLTTCRHASQIARA